MFDVRPLTWHFIELNIQHPTSNIQCSMEEGNMNAIVPIARCEMSVRLASENDYSFIDRLQDMHSKALGFMPKAQLQGKNKLGHVLIAEDEMRLPIGYCMSQDRYFKRDDVGIIYQMNVVPGAQRKL